MKRLYLDVCTLCRPFDDQNAMRIRLETDAYYLIVQNVQSGKYAMITSPVHFKEIDAIEDARERLEVKVLLNKYGVQPSVDLRKTRERAEYLYSLKFGVADAAHLAFAEETADFFISCDDSFLKRCKKHKVGIAALNPVEFCIKENLR